MRVAGAAAREMLVKAAAARWNVDAGGCTTKSNRVLHAQSGRSLGYGELVADAATYTPSSNPTLKSRNQYTLVGKSIARVDIPKKVNGTTTYGVDVKLPGMVYAAIRIAPVFGSKLASVDTGAVAGRRGVLKVVKLDDAVVVVADRFWRARDAVAALNPVFNSVADDSVNSAQLKSRRVTALAGADLKKDKTIGNGADALNGARMIEATYTVPYLAHATMEPMNATAVAARKGYVPSPSYGRRVWTPVARLLQLPRTRCARRDGNTGHTGEADLYARTGHAARLLSP
jgi:isoquinoline 1-oxidoreductase beta subunit